MSNDLSRFTINTEDANKAIPMPDFVERLEALERRCSNIETDDTMLFDGIDAKRERIEKLEDDVVEQNRGVLRLEGHCGKLEMLVAFLIKNAAHHSIFGVALEANPDDLREAMDAVEIAHLPREYYHRLGETLDYLIAEKAANDNP